MILARVTGEIVTTIGHGFYRGKRMLVLEKLAPDGRPAGGYLIAIDAVDAGVGQTVLVIDEGNSARQIVGDAAAPLRSIIVGVVDAVELAR